MGAIGDVNLGDVVQAAESGQAPQATGNVQDNSTAPTTQNNSSSEEPLNLDGVVKFKLGDREWTPDQLRKSILMHSDYTKKTQAVAETQKYWDNLDYDLDKVRSNPQLAQAFRQTYPKAFHKYLKDTGSEANQTPVDRPAVDPELLERFSRIENYVQEKEIQANEARIDAVFATLSKKYPDGDEDVVLARAQAMIDKGESVDERVWEHLWKNSHDKYQQKFESRQKQTLTNQRNANLMARGPASGGGTPASAPPTTKMNMKQATDYAIKQLSGKG